MEGRGFDFSVKVVVVGDSGVGKSCILQRYIRSKFDEHSQPTLGVDFLTKTIDVHGRRIEVQLWDTAGQELFRAVTRGYYRGSSGALFVFDLTRKETFASLEKWVDDVRNTVKVNIATILIGNKSDLTDTREVNNEDAVEFARSHGMEYFETSALTGDGITEAVQKCVEIIDERTDTGQIEIPTAAASILCPSEAKPPEKKGCC